MIATIAELLATRLDSRITGDAGHDAISFEVAVRTAAGVAARAGSSCRQLPRVAVLLPQGPAVAGAILGTMTAATAIPLNPRLTLAELTFALRDAEADLLLTDGTMEHSAELAANLALRAVDLADCVDEHLHSPHSAIREPAPDDTALLLHTSGTTARPKLVPLTHTNLLASAAAVARTLELGPDDRGLGVMPLFHIHGIVGSLLASLSAGAALHITRFDALQLQRSLTRHRITWMSAVPTMYQAMLLRPTGASPDTLRLVRSSSAPLPLEVWNQLQARLDCRVVNSYGMSEAAHQMASTGVGGDADARGTVGRAAGPELAVLTPRGVAREGEGELVVRGPSVMSEYLSPLEANKTAFVDDWFRTGDTGTIDADGRIRLSGRLKEIINVGGEKVSPFEVDDVLLSHPSVAEAISFAAPSRLLGEVVHAAVVLRAAADESLLQRHARERLAKCKVPARIHIVDEIPKGSTGKVQRLHLAVQLGVSE